jgi:pentapeptide repeat protein
MLRTPAARCGASGQDSAVEVTPPRAPESRGILGLLRRDVLARELLIGLVLVGVGAAATFWIAYRQDRLARDLESASEIQENVRFVRQVVIDNAAEKPFHGLNLSGADLAGLDLACEDITAVPPSGCADLFGANLIGTKLSGAELTASDTVARTTAISGLRYTRGVDTRTSGGVIAGHRSAKARTASCAGELS